MGGNIQNTAENTLVVSIEQATDAGEGCNTKHTDIFHERLRPGLANKGKTTLKGSIAELGGLLCSNHLAALLQMSVYDGDTLQDGNNIERTVRRDLIVFLSQTPSCNPSFRLILAG